MDEANPVFEKHYRDYLRQLESVNLAACAPFLGVTVDEDKTAVRIPFFNTLYRVSRSGVTDERGRRPDYGICVILLKYLLLCPQQTPSQTDWTSYRDFPDYGQARDQGLAAYAAQAIAKRYAGRLEGLKVACRALDGRPPQADYPYDLSLVFSALPRVPVLFLFNDADEQFPAKASILYERRASAFLDAECRVMVDWYLFEQLKQAET